MYHSISPKTTKSGAKMLEKEALRMTLKHWRWRHVNLASYVPVLLLMSALMIKTINTAYATVLNLNELVGTGNVTRAGVKSVSLRAKLRYNIKSIGSNIVCLCACL